MAEDQAVESSLDATLVVIAVIVVAVVILSLILRKVGLNACIGEAGRLDVPGTNSLGMVALQVLCRFMMMF